MIPDSSLDALCRLAQTSLGVPRNIRACGYPAIRDRVTPTDVTAHLERHPEYLRAWQNYSMDKRTSGGWYLEQRVESGHWLLTRGWSTRSPEFTWRVGSLTLPNPDQYFTSAASACGEFILREVEFWYCLLTFRTPRWPARDTPEREERSR